RAVGEAPLGAPRAVPAGAGTVALGVDHHPEAAVEAHLEQLVEQAGGLACGHERHRLAPQNPPARPRATREQAFVEIAELARRPPRAAAGPADRTRLGRAGPRPVGMRHRFDLGAVHRRDAVAVALMDVRRHADPTVVHAQRLEDRFAHVVAEVAAIEAADHLAEYVPPRRNVIGTAFA